MLASSEHSHANDDSVASAHTPASGGKWAKRLGAAAFLFFLIKGLAWLVVPAAIAVFATR